MVVSQLLAVLDDLLATDPHDLVDRQRADALIEFEQIARRLDAARARTLAVFDSRRACAADGYPTTTSWLRAQCGSSRGAASSAVRLARGLRDLPLTASALGDGRISAAHAAAITGLLPAIPLQRLLETEAQFVTLAELWEPGQLHRYAQTVRHAY
ncbi:MAG: DUF222 domain-containing protein, partial [Actinomycetota bacterium]